MKFRWLFCIACAVFGLILLAVGLLVPAHLRALDVGVVQVAGQSDPALPDKIRALMGQKKLGTAQLLLQAAQIQISGMDSVASAWTNLVRQQPGSRFWGDDARMENLFGNNFQPADQDSSFSDFIVRQENRRLALAQLAGSQNPGVVELLRSRSLNNTVIFSPAQSAAGQAFDAAVSTTGLLLDGGYLSTGLGSNILGYATQANHGGDLQPLEQILMDFTSLGERFNWDQLTAFTATVPDRETLHQLADDVRNAGDKLPVLFAVVVVSGQSSAVADYLAKFPKTGLTDLGASLRFGTGGTRELAQSGQRLHESERVPLAAAGDFYAGMAKYYARHPEPMLAVKWVMYLLSGFFLALALHFARPAASSLERPLQVRGMYLIRGFLFSLGFLLVVLLWSEPFLAQDNQGAGFTLRLLPPTTGGAFPAGISGVQKMIMSPTILITLLVFFVLQALLYISCLVKLAEIRRQNVPPRIKLKLLENEDHLFDAGLYLGFVGTIISLIVASMGLVKFSLMAAYSSTSFGIIFVVIFKIFHLRPERRKLLLEAEAAAEAVVPARATQPVTPP
ncbi:MAG TPA: hypothetical protein VK742_13035 [Candidatus Sulfotelmatobacter sp.]|jgi:hypothetical protein|nr:hypothetical protein [Candidatus Sulfotelmatobacter sp.]